MNENVDVNANETQPNTTEFLVIYSIRYKNMLKTLFSIALFLFALLSKAQNNELTIAEIWSGELTPRSIKKVYPMNNGRHFTMLKHDNAGALINLFSYKAYKKIKTIIHSKDIDSLEGFSSYKFSPDEKLILLTTKESKIHRYSKKAIYYLYSIKKKTATKVFDKKIQEPTFSPNGKHIAFVFKNNLYIRDLDKNEVIQITKDGKKNEIINGISDRIYEEEFKLVRAFEWSKDSKFIAFIRFDEREVKQVSIPIYGQKENSYPSMITFKYPKAGEKTSKVSLHYYSLNSKKIYALDLNRNDEFYIPKLIVTSSPSYFAAFISNRHQNELDMIRFNAQTGEVKKIFIEKDSAYVNASDLDILFLKNGNFIWKSDRDGFTHLYLYDEEGNVLNQITKGTWEVTELYGVNKKNEVFYQSTKNGSINRGIYKSGIYSGKMEALAEENGISSAEFSKNFRYFIHEFSNSSSPPIYTSRSSKTKKILKIIEDNHDLKKKAKAYALPQKEFITIRNKSGVPLNAWIIKPPNFDPNKKHPLFMYVYGGPGYQTVKNIWRGIDKEYWYQYLATKGFVVASVDNRGTGGKGRDFKKMTYLRLGKYEIEDQIDAAKYLGSLSYIDANNIGIFGWSYGGYMATLALTEGADVFKIGIAIALVSNWKYYDSIYTERYMRTPQENEKGYKESSPVYYANKIKGHYLLIHGSADDNVHYQHAMQMAKALVEANINFDMHIYVDEDHGIYGRRARENLFRKMTQFIFRHLKPH